MAEQRLPRLRVVRDEPHSTREPELARRDYWAQVQALREQRARLRAG